MIPGASVRMIAPWRRAIRRMTFSEYWSSSLVPMIVCSTTLAAAMTSEARSASPNVPIWTSSGSTRSASMSRPASASSRSRKPSASMNGSRSAARIGGTMALRTAMRAATRNAAPVASSANPGTTHAATVMDAAETIHETIVRTSPRRGVAGSQRTLSP
jgi:hypothetical protein